MYVKSALHIYIYVKSAYPCGLGLHKVYEPYNFDFKIEYKCAFLLKEMSLIFIRFLKGSLNIKLIHNF